jgi:thioredoxin-dependent peroxiredoxin
VRPQCRVLLWRTAAPRTGFDQDRRHLAAGVSRSATSGWFRGIIAGEPVDLTTSEETCVAAWQVPVSMSAGAVFDSYRHEIEQVTLMRCVNSSTAAPGSDGDSAIATTAAVPARQPEPVRYLDKDVPDEALEPAAASRVLGGGGWSPPIKTTCGPHSSGQEKQPTRRRIMTLAIGDTAPDFEAQTTEGPIRFHEWIGDSWAVLFSHPKDFTPVCTTELGYMAKIKPEFDRRGVKIIGLSVDATGDHEKWAADIEETQGTAPNYPIIADADFNVAKLYGMLPASTSGDAKARTPAENQTVRNVFVVGPDKKIKLILVYPMTTGRNFDEVLRVIDSLQLTAKHRVSTPVNWKPGEDVIIAGSVSNAEAKEIFGDWEEPKPYIRIVPQPS